jgi:hypothetical protein
MSSQAGLMAWRQSSVARPFWNVCELCGWMRGEVGKWTVASTAVLSIILDVRKLAPMRANFPLKRVGAKAPSTVSACGFREISSICSPAVPNNLGLRI